LTFCFFLEQLCNATPAIATALEIGSSAEQYVSEGDYRSALDKFQSSLGILIPLLSNEPKGHRRDLLHNQIQLWMTQAESTKALLCVEDFKDAIIPDNIGKYCCENLEKGGNYLSYLKHKIIFCYESYYISVL
jgi:hypothetical protein